MANRSMAAALALLLGTASAYAQPTNDLAKPFTETEKEMILAALSRTGYTAPANIHRAGSGFLVTAMKDERQQDVWVDPQSGVVRPVK
jgi:hypothetical protein